MAKEVQNSRSGETKRTAEDLVEFFNRVRSYLTIFCIHFLLFPLLNFENRYLCIFQVRKGSGAPNEEIIGFAKLFNDDLTLDNISRLVSVLVVFVFE